MSSWKKMIWRQAANLNAHSDPYKDFLKTAMSAAETIAEASRASTALGAVAAVSSLASLALDASEILEQVTAPDPKLNLTASIEGQAERILFHLLSGYGVKSYNKDRDQAEYRWFVDREMIALAIDYGSNRSHIDLRIYNEEKFLVLVRKVLDDRAAEGLNWLTIEIGSDRDVPGEPCSYASIRKSENIGKQFESLDRAFDRSVGRERFVMAVVGPAGAGKTSAVMNRIVGKRVLSLRAKESWALPSFLPIIRILNPEVVIFDDVELKPVFVEPLARLIESCGEIVPLLIMTYMKDDIGFKDLKPGEVYWPGLRPGRVDELVLIRPPDREDREAILRHYKCPEGLIREASDLSDGLTGAFLKELAHRLQFSPDVPLTVRDLRIQAPREFSSSLESHHDDDGDDE